VKKKANVGKHTM